MTIAQRLHELQQEYGFGFAKPLPRDVVVTATQTLGLSSHFAELYAVTNGLSHEWFTILPIEDREDPKKTWDSIQRANDITKSKFGVDAAVLDRFVIFSEIGAGECAVLNKSDGSIWYEENGEFQRTDLDLAGFINTCLREVEELRQFEAPIAVTSSLP